MFQTTNQSIHIYIDIIHGMVCLTVPWSPYHQGAASAGRCQGHRAPDLRALSDTRTSPAMTCRKADSPGLNGCFLGEIRHMYS